MHCLLYIETVIIAPGQLCIFFYKSQTKHGLAPHKNLLGSDLARVLSLHWPRQPMWLRFLIKWVRHKTGSHSSGQAGRPMTYNFLFVERRVALKSYQEEAGHLSLNSDYIFIEMLLNKY